MEKPKKKLNLNNYDNHYTGYNQACNDWEAYHEQEISKLQCAYDECKRQRKVLEDKEKRLSLLPSEKEKAK